MPIADLYIARMPKQINIKKLSCDARNKEISSLTNKQVMAEKYYVWKLLEYAVQNSYGVTCKNIDFKKTDSGKWVTDGFFFSLSHSKDAIAVAISDSPIGIDIEHVDKNRSARIANRIMTPEEYSHYDALGNDDKACYLIGCWTAKEAYFKAGESKIFEPSKILSDDGSLVTRKAELNGCEYMYSVCTEERQALRIFDNIDIQ